jgi:hypothetical protein
LNARVFVWITWHKQDLLPPASVTAVRSATAKLLQEMTDGVRKITQGLDLGLPLGMEE